MPWYTGPSLLGHLEQIEVADTAASQPFGMLVQWVSRPSLDFRGYWGTIATGQLRVGTTSSTVTRLLVAGADQATAAAGDAVTVTLADEIALSRSANIAWQELSVDCESRAAMKGQRPKVVWFTGLSGSGKSTIANLVERKLHAAGRHTYTLDGDNVRHGLNRDLGFTEADRVETIRRVAEVAALMADAGLIVLVSFISPYRAERQMARELRPEGDFIEVFVDTPIQACRRRDVKRLYAKADAGLLRNFTGVDAPYEPSEKSSLSLRTIEANPESLADMALNLVASD
jgi:adenylyl-sulfate kinase